MLQDIPIGYSDHTIGADTAIAATAIGSPIIEKHFTLDNEKIGMDNQMATMPEEFKSMIEACNKTVSIMGNSLREITQEEYDQRIMMRRSVISRVPIPKDKVLTTEDLAYKRPGSGIPPTEASIIIGKKAIRNIEADELLSQSDFI